ncbi:OmpP1/FadL family transporter [Olivibacter sitiensis]|uniref:OmpP1/FadL family transporter n=1 Tax=Olivibacter sitiensis TaxID=376470 RepID=UPI0004056327|nr:hypothetical protein [Olivibacter sitiensis]
MRSFTSIAITAGVLGLATLNAHAQTADELFNYSQSELGATARFKGLGGAQTALGGDISNISGNPAGLGFFNSSDFSVSLDYFGTKNRADYFGTRTNTNDTRVGLNQAGIVFNMPTYKARGSNLDQGWLNFNVGVGYAKTNSFAGKMGIYGNNTEDSFVDLMNEDLGELYDWGYDGKLFATYLPSGASQRLSFPGNALGNEGYTDVITRGHQSETSLSFGANHSNTFYIGGSLNFSAIRSEKRYRYEEYGRMLNRQELEAIQADGYPNIDFLDQANYPDLYQLIDSDYELAYGENLRQTGNGFNAKLGFIYRPVDAVRIGFTATTPTWYSMSETYENSFSNYFVDPGSGQDIDGYEVDWYPNVYDYNIRTPYRLNAGLATVFSRGLISADIEYVDYKSTHFSANDTGLERDINDAIQNTYKGALNYRIGGELVVVPQFLLRAGFNYRGNAYEDSANFSSASKTISGGLGYRYDNFYVDATYQNVSADPYNMEAYAGSPLADIKTNRNNVFLTVGFKF